MIYIKQYNSLFDSPRVEEPSYESVRPYPLTFALAIYQKWICSKIEVIGDHTWQDLQEVIEGVDYEIIEEVQKGFPPVIFGAIPITPKPDDLVLGVREEDSLASDNEKTEVL